MEIAAHERGTFCFPELNAKDIEPAKRFYGDLLGWSAVDVPGAGGNYSLFQLHGKDVAGLRRVQHGPQRWVSHILVESAEDTVARARELGATANTPPVDVTDMSRTCVVDDPEGAAFGLWEARGHQGVGLVEEAGTMCWVELLARDLAVARSFYTGLFGWKPLETDKYGFPYTIFKIGAESVSGALQFEADWGVTPRWQVFFAVDKFEGAVGRAKMLGGEVEFAREVPHAGRLGLFRDTGNAVFVIMRPNAL